MEAKLGYEKYAEMSALHLAIKNNIIEIISLLLGQTELDINIELIEIDSIISISLLALGFIS